MSPTPLFPIMAVIYDAYDDIREMRAAGVASLIIGIPWSLILPHEAQAQTNLGQSLKRLAERGGLDASEAVAVLEDRRWRDMTRADANQRLAELVAASIGDPA